MFFLEATDDSSETGKAVEEICNDLCQPAESTANALIMLIFTHCLFPMLRQPLDCLLRPLAA